MMLFTLFASELLLIIPDLIDRFTSHVTMFIDAPDVPTPDRQGSFTATTYCFDAMSCSVLCGEDEGSLMK